MRIAAKKSRCQDDSGIENQYYFTENLYMVVNLYC